MITSTRLQLSATMLALLLSAQVQGAVPVIPGASGYGIETPAGRGGQIYRVTSLAETGSGTLAECVVASGPRICVFEVSGVIRLTKMLSIRNPNITIAGQTAPSPGIMLRGAPLGINASDVLVQHITVRVGDDLEGPSMSSRDALLIYNYSTTNTIQRVVIDHVSLSWSMDEIATVQGIVDDVTFNNTVFGQALNDSLHPDGPHGFGPMATGGARRVSYIGNLLAHTTDRNVNSRAQNFSFVNNVVYNYGYVGTRIGAALTEINGATISSNSSVVGNTYIRGLDAWAGAQAVLLSGGTIPVAEGSKVYLKDNVGTQPNGSPATSDPWSIVKNETSWSRSQLEAAAAPTWPSGLVALPTKDGQAMRHVLANAGSRPVERDAVDQRIIKEVLEGTGWIINCVSADGSERCSRNGGGWPTYAQNRRALDIPTNPNADDNGDGYTNVEEWLHMWAAVVEGRSEVARPQPPTVTTIK